MTNTVTFDNINPKKLVEAKLKGAEELQSFCQNIVNKANIFDSQVRSTITIAISLYKDFISNETYNNLKNKDIKTRGLAEHQDAIKNTSSSPEYLVRLFNTLDDSTQSDFKAMILENFPLKTLIKIAMISDDFKPEVMDKLRKVIHNMNSENEIGKDHYINKIIDIHKKGYGDEILEDTIAFTKNMVLLAKSSESLELISKEDLIKIEYNVLEKDDYLNSANFILYIEDSKKELHIKNIIQADNEQALLLAIQSEYLSNDEINTLKNQIDIKHEASKIHGNELSINHKSSVLSEMSKNLKTHHKEHINELDR